MNTTRLTETFDLLEALARNGIIKVTINQPPVEYGYSTLPGIFALIPNVKQKYSSYPSDLLWRTLDNHGGMSCGNGMGFTKDKKYYWCQAQTKEKFHTGKYTWVGQETNNYRQWYCEEIVNQLLDIK